MTRAISILTGFIGCLLLFGCSDKGPTQPLDNPSFSFELFLGKITVFEDGCYSFNEARVVAVGYRDSLGDGRKQPIISVSYRKTLFHLHIDPLPGMQSISRVNYDGYSRTFLAAAEGSAAIANCARISTRDSSITPFRIPYQGDFVHPSEIVPIGDGNIAVSGWVEDGGVEKGFLIVLAADNTISWSRYYSTPGKKIRCANLVQDDSGFVLAMTESTGGSPSNFERSYLQTVTFAGTDREIIEIGVTDFRIRDLVWNQDTGYSVIGEIMHVPRTGYVGLLDEYGNELWNADLSDDSLFIPISMTGPTSSISNHIVGNKNNRAMFASMTYYGSVQIIKFSLLEARDEVDIYNISSRVIPEQSVAWITIAVKDYSLDASGNIIKATAAIYY